MKVLINALRTRSSGSLTYLNGMLPYLAQNEALELVVVTHKNTLSRIKAPENVRVETTDCGETFWQTLWWEQVELPKLAKKLGIKSVLTIANFGPLVVPNPVVFLTNTPNVANFEQHLPRRAYWYAMTWLARLYIVRCPAVLVNGSFLKELYAPIWMEWTHKKFRTAHPACTVTKEKSDIKKRHDQIIAVGDLYAHKNYPVLLHAFKTVLQKVPDARLLIVGDSIDEATSNKIKAIIYDLDLQYAVQLRGSIKRDELAELYAQSGVFVSVSLAEAFSLTVLEAMCHGLPVVVGDFPFMHEVGGDVVKYAPQIDDASAERNAGYVAANILQILEDSALANKLGKKARERGLSFSWDKTARVVTDVLFDLAKRKR